MLAAASAIVNMLAPLLPAVARLREIVRSLPHGVVWVAASGLLCLQAIRLVLTWIGGAQVRRRSAVRVRQPGPLARLREDLTCVDARPHRRERVALLVRSSVIADVALARDLSERDARAAVEKGEWTDDPRLAEGLARLWRLSRDRAGPPARDASYRAETEDFLSRMAVSRAASGSPAGGRDEA